MTSRVFQLFPRRFGLQPLARGLKRRWLYSVLIAGVIAAAAAPVARASAGWTDFGTISNLNQQPASGNGNSGVFVNIATTVNPSGCSEGTGYYFTVVDDRTTRLFTMLLSAQATGRVVQVYLTGPCFLGYAVMDGLVIQ